LRNLVRRLQSWLLAATRPHPRVTDEVLREKARLLATVTLALVPLHLLVALVLYGVYGPAIWSWRVALLGAAMMAGLYVLSRRQRVILAVNLFIMGAALLALLVVYVNADSFSTVTALLPIYFASMFRSRLRLILTAVVTLALVFIMPGLLPGDWTNFYGTFLLLVFTTVMIAIRAHFQWEAEAKLRQRSRELAESEARFRGAIDASISMFFLLKAARGADGQIEDFILVDVNAQVLKRYQRAYAELVNQPVSKVIPAVYQDELFTECKRVVETGTPAFKEVQSANRWWQYEAVPMGDGAAVIGFDITTRKEAEQRRVELEIERERVSILQRFIQDMSHDLLTPLSIINSSSYLLGKAEAPDQRERHLRQINQQVERLKGMFDDMLAQSRLDSLSAHDLQRAPADLNPLLAKLVESFAEAAAARSQSLAFQPHHEAAVVLVDARLMEIALGNLIDNGLKYTPERGIIHVWCQGGVQEIEVVVDDSGGGIPEDELPLIFERFYRVEAHRPLTAGMGLGLSISRKIIELHGGRIAAENRREGGMRFRVSLVRP
jgi:C4-dicarboxylate-specific signal transduction histidine kinase